MTDNLFDNFVKEKMQHHSSAVPADMWERIVNNKEKRRGLLWWKYFFAMGILCLVAGAVWLGLNTNTTNKTLTSNPVAVVENEKNVLPASSAIAQATSVAAGLKKETGINEANQKQNVVNLKSSNRESDNKDETGSGSSEDASDFSEANPAEVTFTSTGKRKASIFKATVFDNNLSSDRSNDVVLENNNNEPEFIFPHPSFLIAEKEQRTYQVFNLSNLKACVASVDCPVNTDRRNDVYVEAFVSPDYSIRKVDAPANQAYYLSRKDSMESKMASFTAGFRLSKSMGEHMMFKTGLQYSQINEKFSFRSEDERRLTTVVTIRTITHSDGSTVQVRDTSIIEQIGYRVATSYNKYKSLDVPVIFGYEFGKEKWKGAINFGAILNLSSWQQGETLDTSFAPVSFNKDSEPIFKKHVGMGLFGSVSLIRNLTPSFDVFAEPYLRYNLTSLTNNTSPFNQKFHVAGCFVGVRYKLNYTRQR